MKRFAALYHTLDATTRTSEKVAAIEAYFRDAPPEDAAWALRFLLGRRFKRSVAYPKLRAWAGEAAGLPDWLLAACHEAVGDFSETIALLLPEPADPRDIPLNELAKQRIAPLARMDDQQRRATLERTWRELTPDQRLVFHKLLSGAFRVGAARKLVIRGLANAHGIDPAVMEHRLGGPWNAAPEDFARLTAPDDENAHPARPYPFFLASPFDDPTEQAAQTLGSTNDWLIEWKWDGIRAQLIRRDDLAILWSRGEEMVGDAFPELLGAAQELPTGTVLDGELLAWDPAAEPILSTHPPAGAPLPFAALQRRLNRAHYEPTLFDDVPVIFLAYDLLEAAGADVREEPIESRRQQMETILRTLPGDTPVRLSPILHACNWHRAEQLKSQARGLGVEGIMLKRKGSPYRTGRTRGDWYKWKVDPLALDVVLIYAQPGSGRRASLFTDYTFGVWDGPGPGEGKLVPIAKAYSGLTDHEIKRVDHFVRTNITGRHGPLRAVTPHLVFELGFEGIAESNRHQSGVALRFPRMLKWRHDKRPEEADTLAAARALLEQTQRERPVKSV